jgi:hypothetical protein
MAGHKPAWLAGLRLFKRRGWDLNPRATFRPPAVFKTAPFDRSGTPPNSIVAEAGFARLRSLTSGVHSPKEGAHWGDHGFPHAKDRPVRPLRHPAEREG